MIIRYLQSTVESERVCHLRNDPKLMTEKQSFRLNGLFTITDSPPPQSYSTPLTNGELIYESIKESKARDILRDILHNNPTYQPVKAEAPWSCEKMSSVPSPSSHSIALLCSYGFLSKWVCVTVIITL